MSIVFHHGVVFVRNFLLYYKGGKENLFNDIDKDRWSYFEATGILKQFRYDDHVKYRLWWHINEEDKYVKIIDDNDTDMISDYVIQNKREAHIYVKHSVIGTVGANVGGGPSNVSGGVDDAAVDVSGGFVR